MLTRRVLLEAPGVSIAEVRCGGGGAVWSPEEPVARFGVVLVRSGLFRRRVEGIELVADPSVAYVEQPGSAQQVAHPSGGDVCTAIALSRSMLGSLVDSDGRLPDRPVFTSSALDFAHRLLLARATQDADEFDLTERATALVGALVEALKDDGSRAVPRSPRRPSRSAVERVRQTLAEDNDLKLHELAGIAGMSPYHLSRTFRRLTGLTLSRYRIRLRARLALDRLAAGDRDLAGIAADVGFADQAHLTRTVRAETGTTPGRLRSLLAGPGTETAPATGRPGPS